MNSFEILLLITHEHLNCKCSVYEEYEQCLKIWLLKAEFLTWNLIY